MGLERQLNIIQGYVKYVLTVEQKKTDFRPEDESRDLNVMSNVCLKKNLNAFYLFVQACLLVVSFLNRVVERIKDGVDGGNLLIVLNDLGDRLYTIILTHIRSFNYNTSGAMLLLCDINEYK